jgi:hypothetical protein
MGLFLTLHSRLVGPYIGELGSEELKRRLLPRCISGETILGIAMTEPGAGSDLAGVRTTARRDGDDYVIRGQKIFISNGQLAYLVVVAGFAGRAEPDLERAARASGADAWTAFRTITLPLLAPVLAGASLIAFVLSMTSFGVPAVLGIPAGFTTMTTRIYRDLAFSADPASYVRSLGLAVVLAVCVAAIRSLPVQASA